MGLESRIRKLVKIVRRDQEWPMALPEGIGMIGRTARRVERRCETHRGLGAVPPRYSTMHPDGPRRWRRHPPPPIRLVDPLGEVPRITLDDIL